MSNLLIPPSAFCLFSKSLILAIRYSAKTFKVRKNEIKLKSYLVEQERLFISIQTRSSLQLTLTEEERATHWIKSSWRQITYSILYCTAKYPKIGNICSQKSNCAATVSISTFMCLWAINIFPQSICLFCRRKFVDRSWKYICKSLRPRNYQKRNTCMEFSLQCVVSACVRTHALEI